MFIKKTKEDVELETLKDFLRNKNIKFDDSLLSSKKNEPTDIRYNNVNYQVTTGDKVLIEKMRRKEASKERKYSHGIKKPDNIIDLLLKESLEKKSIRSDKNTILLIDVMRDGFLSLENLKKQASNWAINNLNLCNVWKEIYLVYSDKNIKII